MSSPFPDFFNLNTNFDLIFMSLISSAITEDTHKKHDADNHNPTVYMKNKV